MTNKENIKIELPKDVKYIIDTLYSNGYEAYVVGGCVRDSILGRPIHDWDLTTNAKPEDIIKIFSKVIPTGIKHGTVTIMLNNVGYEITTYRIDKNCDGRHAEVEFCNNLKEDLSRRDFTINAMAYNEEEGLIDYFGGLEDIDNRIVRFVGKAEDRIKEDYLRILRAIRFSKQLGFHIPRCELNKMYIEIDNIEKYVSVERRRDEFNKILLKLNVKDYNKTFLEDLLYIFGLLELENVNQDNPYHCYDVLRHTLTSISCVDTLELKLVMLFHDIGKGRCKIKDENGIDHFYGHAKVSKEIAEKWLTKYKYDNKTKNMILTLIENHDIQFSTTEKFIKKMLNKFGEEIFRKLIKVRKADILAQNPQYTLDRLEKVFKVEELLDKVLKENQCFKLKDLAVNGNDMINIGFKGKEIGFYLDYLLQSVINGTIDNDKNELLNKSKSLFNLRHT